MNIPHSVPSAVKKLLKSNIEAVTEAFGKPHPEKGSK